MPMTTPLLCATVTGGTMTELRAARDAATMADMVEVRLDGVSDLDVAGALADRRAPVLATCRPAWEGGRFAGSEEERRAILARALALGAEYVDVEWRAGFGDLVRRDPARVVLSAHDFDGVPPGLEDQVRAMRAEGAGTIKVAVTTPRLTDTLALSGVARGGNAVVVGMGDAGVPTRLLAGRYGSRWTYAGDGVAPGQVPAHRMVDELGFRRVGPDTRLFGVVSTGAMHSLSPRMHNAAFAAAGVDAVYVPLTTSTFDDFLGFADALGIVGASVTIPFKLDALRAADRVEQVGLRVGAANTLRRHAGRWEATNTDVDGFLAPLEPLLGRRLGGVRVAVLGAGGAARAVIFGLARGGAAVSVHARRREQARAIAAAFGVAAGEWPPAAGSWDVLVNCTPLGGATAPTASPLPGGPFTGRLVYDLTYRSGVAPLLAEAREAGCRVIDGLPMLVAQAERQFAWWTGQPAPAGVMDAAVRREAGVPATAARQGS
jgi:3-dehydroquinate dehydratase/shikimate dehydrogenase